MIFNINEENVTKDEINEIIRLFEEKKNNNLNISDEHKLKIKNKGT